MDVDFYNKTQEILLKTLPAFKGSCLIYTKLLTLLPKKFQLCTLKESSMHLDLSDPAQLSIVKVRRGKHEVGTVNFIKKFLSEGDVFVDVGANFGYFSCIASKIVGEHGLVLSFEPNKTAFNQLVSTAIRNQLFNVVPMHLALGEKEKTRVQMKKSFCRQNTSSYMVDGNAVLSNSFDHFIKIFDTTKKIKMIKIDVEGAELPVIKGLKSILTTHKPFLIVEPDSNSDQRFGFKFNELISFLETLGYNPSFCLNQNDPGKILTYNEEIKYCPIVFNHSSTALAKNN